MSKFTVECKMEDRWIPYFLGMLQHMENLGNIGSSRVIGFYSDGDGDFRPEFKYHKKKPLATPKLNTGKKCDIFYDAG